MKHGADGSIPRKDRTGEQVEREITPSEVEKAPNVDLADLRIDVAKLFIEATEQTRMALCVSDPYQDDCPIVYLNEAFCVLTGYSREEVIGTNCRFLQGKDTDRGAVARIRKALEDEEVKVIDILNYKKDGTPFWNAVHVGPVYDDNGRLAYYYGSQWDITDVLNERDRASARNELAREMQHRTDNLFSVIIAIIRLTARGETDAAILADKVVNRIQALSSAQHASISPYGMTEDMTHLDQLVEDVLAPYRTTEKHRIAIDGKDLLLPRRFATPVGLALHELATNALKYGSLSVPEGRVNVDWSLCDGVFTMHWIESNGPKLDGASLETKGTGMGMRLIRNVLKGVGGHIDVSFETTGVRAVLTFPFHEETSQ